MDPTVLGLVLNVEVTSIGESELTIGLTELEIEGMSNL